VRWTVHGERSIYQSSWVNLALADVGLPDGRRIDHHVVRMPRAAAGVVAHDPDRGVLLMWRHRFITDTWGWEIPAGGVETGESPEEGAAREALEETGWQPGSLRPMASYHPNNGISDMTYHLFFAAGATYVGPPSDPTEAERVAWVPVAELRKLIRSGEFTDGMSFAAVCYALAFENL
jgi:8-oxo-dGTP pyrophosphatase MutT (NUDIX family)